MPSGKGSSSYTERASSTMIRQINIVIDTSAYGVGGGVTDVILFGKKKSISTACRKEILFRVAACRMEVKSSFPLPPSGPYRLEGITWSDRLAASGNHKHSW